MQKETPQEFFTFVDNKLRELGISERELLRRSKLSPSVISKARTKAQPIGYKACAKLAPVLDVPEELLWQLAGLKAKTPAVKLDPESQEFLHLYRKAAPERKRMILRIAREILGEQIAEEKTRERERVKSSR